MRKNSIILIAVLLFVVLVLTLTGLVPAWGQWYTIGRPQHIRAQVDALSRHELALSDSPSFLDLDLSWSEGGVQHVRGLGIPVWQLTYVALARLCGFDSFPDVVIFGLALGLAAFFVVKSFSTCISVQGDANPNRSSLNIAAFGAILIWFFFPPFIGLLRSRFTEYEFIVAYEYIFALLLISQLSVLILRWSRTRYLVLCLLAGIGGFIRPTLVFYGISTLLCSGFILLKTPQKKKDLLITFITGCFVFAVGNGLLFTTNYVRFGNGFEFGQNLNLEPPGLMYASRFDHPYQDEPTVSALQELFGHVFLVKELNGQDFFRKQFFTGQSETMRYRELYLTTFDISYLVLLIGGWTAGIMSARNVMKIRKKETRDHVADRLILVLTAWSTVAIVLLSVLYMRLFFIASRYVLDFMPAFAAIITALWLMLARVCFKFTFPSRILACLLICLGVWMMWQISRSHCLYGGPQVGTWEELKNKFPEKTAMPVAELSGEYGITSNDAPLDGIPGNGGGWHSVTGAAMPAVTLFVQNPRFLELHIVCDEAAATEEKLMPVRAKIGLEFLERASITRSGEVWKVRFQGPKASRYQTGLQPVFLALSPKSDFASQKTSLRLLKVRWKE